jgi:hypothetical protein
MQEEPDIPNEVKLADALRRTLGTGGQNKNYLIDIAGDLGISKYAPTVTNAPSTLEVSAHGGQLSGFAPDPSATNELAKIITERRNKGGQLSLEDIASTMGSATNEVQRAVIDACYAAGYNFNHVKSLFPNLKELVAPSTSSPTSALTTRDLTRPTPEQPGGGHSTPGISPFFAVTPSSTNVISKASDWLPTSMAKKVIAPLTEHELSLQQSYASHPADNLWGPTNYSSKAYLPASVIMKQMDDVLAWQKEQYRGKHLTDKEFDDILKESNRRISEIIK